MMVPHSFDMLIKNLRNIESTLKVMQDGNYNTNRMVDELIDEITEGYHEWADEKRSEEWDSEGKKYLREYIENEGEFDEDAARNHIYPLDNRDLRKVLAVPPFLEAQ